MTNFTWGQEKGEIHLLPKGMYLLIGKCKEGIDYKIQEHMNVFGMPPKFIFIYPKTLKKLFPEFLWSKDIRGIFEYKGIPVIKMKSKKMAEHWGSLKGGEA